MIGLEDARRIAERLLRFRPDDEDLLERPSGWLVGGGIQSLVQGRFSSRTGIGAPIWIVEKSTGAAFSVPSSLGAMLVQGLAALDAGFRRPFYDLTITSVNDRDTTTECLLSLADIMEQCAPGGSSKPAAIVGADDLPQTIGPVPVWLASGPIARINSTGCCSYFAQEASREKALSEWRIPVGGPDRPYVFHLTVVAVHEITAAVELLAALGACAIDADSVDPALRWLREPLAREQIRELLTTVPARCIVRARRVDGVVALTSSAACSCIWERALEGSVI
jgi:hypothetical protein